MLCNWKRKVWERIQQLCRAVFYRFTIPILRLIVRHNTRRRTSDSSTPVMLFSKSHENMFGNIRTHTCYGCLWCMCWNKMTVPHAGVSVLDDSGIWVRVQGRWRTPQADRGLWRISIPAESRTRDGMCGVSMYHLDDVKDEHHLCEAMVNEWAPSFIVLSPVLPFSK